MKKKEKNNRAEYLKTWNYMKTTAQKMKFSIKDFFSKCNRTGVSCGFGHIS